MPLKKRLIGVITVKDGRAVQSFGYDRYLPLGRAECIAENLDRWGADEILVLCIDRTRRGLGPDLQLLRRIGALGLSTPLTYGGGVSTVAHAAAVIQCGAERVCIDAALRSHVQSVRDMAALLGAQALIGVFPVSRDDEGISLYDHVSRRSNLLKTQDLSLFREQVLSEALLVDWRHEGQPNSFDIELVRQFPLDGVPLIAFGGISEAAQIDTLLTSPEIVAVGVGNFLNYSEHAVQRLKHHLIRSPLRRAVYVSQH